MKMKTIVLILATFACAASSFTASAAPELAPATPESQGVSSRAIRRWIDFCEKKMRLHGFVIARHGRTIAEGWWKPFGPDQTHMLYSHSKSFTSCAVGFLVDDGLLDLDARVISFFPDKTPKNPSENLRQLRVRDLLTMNTGTKLADRMRSCGDLDWERAFLENTFDYEPGTRFQYDSSATHMLACIVERVTGRKLMDFLKERLFDPIGIEKAWTTTSPTGRACGGWGMNMTTREIARFAQFCLQEGRWGDRQILSREWMRLATSRQSRSGWDGVNKLRDSDWYRGYGFQFWRMRHDAYRADGAFGQYSLIFPDKDTIVSITASLEDMKAELDAVWDYLYPALQDGALAEDPEGVADLRARCAALALPVVAGAAKPADGSFAARATADGTTFKLKGESNTLRLDDLRLKAMADGGWELSFTGACGRQVVPVGFGEWKTGSVRLQKESYEALGALIGDQPTATSGAWIAPDTFRAFTHLTGGVYTLETTITFKDDGTASVSYTFWGMNGAEARLEGRDLVRLE